MRLIGRRTLLLGTAVLAVLGLFWARREAHGFRNALSPSYWGERFRGTAYYDPDRNYLRHGDPGRREIALTFDDGPHPESAAMILDILKAKRVRATFFLVGSRIKEHPELVRRMLREGHLVGNHTQNHIRLTTLKPNQVENEIRNCAVNFDRATGSDRLTFFRPPGMRFDDKVLDVIRQEGYIMVGWSDAAKDFISVQNPHPDPSLVRKRIGDQVENGSIILLHDIPSTAEVLSGVIDEIRNRGFRFVTVDEMLERVAPGAAAQAAKMKAR